MCKFFAIVVAAIRVTLGLAVAMMVVRVRDSSRRRRPVLISIKAHPQQ